MAKGKNFAVAMKDPNQVTELTKSGPDLIKWAFYERADDFPKRGSCRRYSSIGPEESKSQTLRLASCSTQTGSDQCVWEFVTQQQKANTLQNRDYRLASPWAVVGSMKGD